MRARTDGVVQQDNWQASLVDSILLEVKIVIENIKKDAESHTTQKERIG